jgi:hypothetical protein
MQAIVPFELSEDCLTLKSLFLSSSFAHFEG